MLFCEIHPREVREPHPAMEELRLWTKPATLLRIGKGRRKRLQRPQRAPARPTMTIGRLDNFASACGPNIKLYHSRARLYRQKDEKTKMDWMEGTRSCKQDAGGYASARRAGINDDAERMRSTLQQGMCTLGGSHT